MKLFLQKNAKFSSAGGSAPRPTTQPPLRISGYAPGSHEDVMWSLNYQAVQKSTTNCIITNIIKLYRHSARLVKQKVWRGVNEYHNGK